MRIGFYDVDLLENLKKPKFNLEIMKLAAHCAWQGHTCEILLPQDFDELASYNKFVLRKDSRFSQIDHRFSINAKVEWGGLALEGGYVPLE